MYLRELMNREIQPISHVVPEGQLVNRKWLAEHGISMPRVDYALRAQLLESVVHGIYRRPGPPLKWEHIVYSLNEMGWQGHVGGRSAFELQGKAHYLPLAGIKRIDLHGPDPAPPWLGKLDSAFVFQSHTKKLFQPLPAEALETKLFGAWDWPIPYSTPELALLELLGECKDEADFHLVDPFFEGAVTLRVDRIQLLLQACRQVKAKRLFLWFAKRHKHAWAGKIDRTKIDLGSGKRELVKGGVLESEYQMTIPREMALGSEQPLF
jgi:hypothetical protein